MSIISNVSAAAHDLCRGEGLVVKNLESVYTLHGREDDWIKVKPEYMDSLGEEVDVSSSAWSTEAS